MVTGYVSSARVHSPVVVFESRSKVTLAMTSIDLRLSLKDVYARKTYTRSSLVVDTLRMKILALARRMSLLDSIELVVKSVIITHSAKNTGVTRKLVLTMVLAMESDDAALKPICLEYSM